MKWLRHLVPVLGVFALAALFLNLPETPNILHFCKSCASSATPYLSLIGAGYFAVLIAVSILFSSFPSKHVARGGLIWAVLLSLVLTYLHSPNWCITCLIAHASHILIWVIWVAIPANLEIHSSTFRERLCLLIFAPIAVVALFSCLNLTFMAYSFKRDFGLQIGASVPTFSVQTTLGKAFTNTTNSYVNFIAPDCPYCKEQLQILNSIIPSSSQRFINVSPNVTPELIQSSPQAEWVEDTNSQLFNLFKVSGYPTLFVVDSSGKITQVIAGVSAQLLARLEQI